MTETKEVCESCEVATDLNDEGRCDACELEFVIRRAEYVRDMAGDR